MSVTDPLLKELKKIILKILKSQIQIFDDAYDDLQLLCETLEVIFLKGLSTTFSPFGNTQKKYWHWIQLLEHIDDNLCRIILEIKASEKVKSSVGKGRLLIRTCLVHRNIHVPVEAMIRRNSLPGTYNSKNSILGSDILGEILLSLLYQLSYFKFNLNLENASFLDQTWLLPSYTILECPPHLYLGIQLIHIDGRAVVYKIEKGSSAAEHNNICVGDLIDEIDGQSIQGCQRGHILAQIEEKKGLPIKLKLIKKCTHSGEIHPLIKPLLDNLGIAYPDTEISSLETQGSPPYPSGEAVEYLGSVGVGSRGDVGQIESAIVSVLSESNCKRLVTLVLGDICAQIFDRESQKVFLSHSFTEISSCGQIKDYPLIFGYIAGDTCCSISSSFTCHVLKGRSRRHVESILHSIADGFQRTQWAV